MIFKPSAVGNRKLSPEVLAQDKKNCVKIGPVGVGRQALYLNSFYIRRRYYIGWTDVRRVFKRVALSKGGFTGKGVFGSMPYLVVEKSDGTQQQCNFKFEGEVDQVLELIGREHPEIPLHSAESERKLRKAQAEREERYVKNLPEDAAQTIRQLEEAKSYLEENPQYSKVLVYAAKEKRSVDGTKTSLKAVASVIVAASVAMAAVGLYLRLTRDYDMGLYMALFGAAFIISVLASKVLPTPSRNRRTVQKDWEEAVRLSQSYLEKYEGGQKGAVSHAGGSRDGAAASNADGRQNEAASSFFPVPPQYAHPIVLERMIRAVKEGRAADAAGALEAVKGDLKALNSSVKVSQEEYDEVVTVKPMFLVCGYE